MAKDPQLKENEIRKAIDDLQDFLYSKTERRPMILPMLIEKK